MESDVYLPGVQGKSLPRRGFMTVFHARLIAAVAATALVLLPAATSAQVTGVDLTQPPGKDWPTVGGNWSNQRYSTLAQINSSNVKNLKGAWMARLNGSGFDAKFSQQATPVVKDGVMYVP